MKSRALFLDRDGVINTDNGYSHVPGDSAIIPGIGRIICTANALGWKTVVVTNQSGIAKGIFGHQQFRDFMAWIGDELAKEGARLDAVYYCPHLAADDNQFYEAGCDCRKPQPGMLLTAAEDLGLSLKDSILLGDKQSDLMAGASAGVRNLILIELEDEPGSGPSIPKRIQDFVVSSLEEGVGIS